MPRGTQVRVLPLRPRAGDRLGTRETGDPGVSTLVSFLTIGSHKDEVTFLRSSPSEPVCNLAQFTALLCRAVIACGHGITGPYTRGKL